MQESAVDAETALDSRPDQDRPFEVIVQSSKRRRKTVGAQLVGDVLTVVVPAWMNDAEQQHWADVMSRRFRRKMSTSRVDLRARANTLADRHDLPRPQEIRWSDDMTTRWASCSPDSGTIRVSSRIAAFPNWVIDYVLVHELAHLRVADHSEAFWKLANRYPRSERAIGYLIAKSGEDDA